MGIADTKQYKDDRERVRMMNQDIKSEPMKGRTAADIFNSWQKRTGQYVLSGPLAALALDLIEAERMDRLIDGRPE